MYPLKKYILFLVHDIVVHCSTRKSYDSKLEETKKFS